MNRNEKFACGFRLVLGGWLVYIGVSLLWTATQEKPSNMFFMGTMGIICVVIGAIYAGWIVKRLLDIRKAERRGTEEEEIVEELPQEYRKEPVDVTLKTQIGETKETVQEEKPKQEEDTQATETESKQGGKTEESSEEAEDASGSGPESVEDSAEIVQEEAERQEEIEKDYEEK